MNTNPKRGDTCPICDMALRLPNRWVRYHVSYEPEMVILACKYCNLVEQRLRTRLPVPSGLLSREIKVIIYHKKYGLKL